MTSSEYLPTETAGLPAAQPPDVVVLGERDELDLRIAPVAEQLGPATVRMLAYNGSVRAARRRALPARGRRTHVLLIEPLGTPNTGEAGGELTASEERI